MEQNRTRVIDAASSVSLAGDAASFHFSPACCVICRHKADTSGYLCRVHLARLCFVSSDDALEFCAILKKEADLEPSLARWTEKVRPKIERRKAEL